MSAARSRSVALEKLSELRVVILEHILKQVALPNHDAVKHWQKEVHSYAKRLKRYHKSKGGKPNYSEALLWEFIWEDQVDELPLGFVDEYGIDKLHLDIREIKQHIGEFIASVLDETG